MMVKVAQTQLNIASPAFKELANSVLAVSIISFNFLVRGADSVDTVYVDIENVQRI